MPPPSLHTNPSRAASKGREALSGSSLRVDIAFMEQNPAMVRGTMMASAPPAIMMSASPRWISRLASPRAWLPVAQAVTTEEFGPLAPKRMDTSPEAMLMMSMGITKGDTRSKPFSRSACSPSRSVVIPPMPEPMSTPKRSLSTLLVSRPASSTAMHAQAMA